MVQEWSFNQLFFSCNIAQENIFYDILKRKNAFLGYKNKKFKKSKNWHFSKGVNPWFCSKNGHFSNFFFFRQHRPGKSLLRYSRKKNAFLGYKNKKFKKSKKPTFFQRGYPCFWSKNRHFLQLFFSRQYRPGRFLLRYSRTKNRLSGL